MIIALTFILDSDVNGKIVELKQMSKKPEKKNEQLTKKRKLDERQDHRKAG